MDNFKLRSFSTPDELAEAAAKAWLDLVEESNGASRKHCVALSGGRITHNLAAAIVSQSKAQSTSLRNVHFFWADERCLPPTDPESNFRTAQDLLFTPLEIAENQIHRIRGEDSPESAAQAAQTEILRVAPTNSSGQPVLDLIFLGLGEDGHTASLFPGEKEEISNSPAVYRAVFNSPKPPPQRVTLGFSAIAAAKNVWMLASGKGKTAALEESLSPNGKTPFARVLNQRSQTLIFTDISFNHQ